MNEMLHLLESFTAQGSDGKTYKVHGYEHMAQDETVVDGQEHWEPTGVAEYRLDDGRLVDVRADGQMFIAGAGVALSTATRAAR